MKHFISCLALTALACGPTIVPPAPPEPTAAPARLCEQPQPGTFGVFPLLDSTKAKLELDGADTLFEAKLHDTGCFELLERKQLKALIEEIKRCEPNNPEREYFDCSTAAQKGNLRGLTRRVTGEIVFFEPDVAGADLQLKLPYVKGIEISRKYAALSLVAKVIDVESGTELATATVHAVVPSDEAGIAVQAGSFDLAASVHDKTPFGQSLDVMLADATSQLVAKLKESAANGASAGAPTGAQAGGAQ
ncbi:MAG TPA: CsgG/HfaB family protein [Polyangiaceae bacterium]|nr:CsgG/HfaB family protein [Polyangiaceae bacterium]